jgi:flagellar motor switch protein FliN/FliY
MSELMTQEEINAMLNGGTVAGGDGDNKPDDSFESAEAVAAQASEESVSGNEPVEAHEPDLANDHVAAEAKDLTDCLTEMEADALGEIGNICMGAAATALYTILGRKVSITTPQVECTTPEKISDAYDIPFVIVDVEYTEGVVGNNLLILRIEDVKIITDIMMGGDGTNTEGELSELHLSAISEAMNQMMGGMSTSMADMLNRIVNISPPKTLIVELSGDEIRHLINSQSDALVKIGFKMEIEGIIDSGIMQLMPMSFAKELVSTVLGSFADESESVNEEAPAASEADDQAAHEALNENNSAAVQTSAESTGSDALPNSGQTQALHTQADAGNQSTAQSEYNQQQPASGFGNAPVEGAPQGMPPYQQYPGYPNYPGYPGYPGYPSQPGQESVAGANGQPGWPPYPPYPPYGYPPYGMPQQPQQAQQPGWPQMPKGRTDEAKSAMPGQHVDVRPVQLGSFDPYEEQGGVPVEDGIDMIMDVPLQITVELGQSKKSIKDILDITVGSIITLDKAAGEPVDIVVNGKMIARGEVIVIDDSYGVRITEIVSPSSRLRNIR